MKIKRTVFALVLGLVLSTAAIAGAATTGRVHWPATCSKFVCVNNHLNALSRRVHHANTRAMTPGPTGATGAAGAQGPAGSAGAQGLQGDQGVQGLQGDQGLQGETGLQGDTGPQGDIGPPGPQGDAGPQGLPGLQGDQGVKGDNGTDGATGPQGPQGAKGDKGDTGDTGPAGPTGPAGQSAVYTTTGTLQSGSHIVVGSGSTNPGGNLNVSLAGSAAFTSGTSYWCIATYQGNSAGTAAPSIQAPSATGFTIKADSSRTLNFICVGN